MRPFTDDGTSASGLMPYAAVPPTRAAVPPAPKPMLASRSKRPPGGAGWAHEFKWDGVRALARWDGQALTFHSRLGNDITGRYPELQLAEQLLAGRPALLDGEIIAVDARGRPNFSLLQNRMHVSDPKRVRALMRTVPCIYMIFDLLWLNGRSTLRLPYVQRREQLDALGLNRGSWQTPEYHFDEGGALLKAAGTLGLEGIVSKRVDSAYDPGRRSPSWIKVRLDLRQEFVIAGWTPGRGNRQGEIGALLVGYYDGGQLRYAGKVGTGFDRAENARLLRLLRQRPLATTPFVDHVPWRDARFVRPEIVAEVKFTEWTGDGKLRHPSYEGQRLDKDPPSIVRET